MNYEQHWRGALPSVAFNAAKKERMAWSQRRLVLIAMEAIERQTSALEEVADDDSDVEGTQG